MFRATGGPAMVGFLPTQLLVKHFNQAPSNSLLTCHYQGLTTEVPSHMCLLLIRLFHYRETSCQPQVHPSWLAVENAFFLSFCTSGGCTGVPLRSTLMLQWCLLKPLVFSITSCGGQPRHLQGGGWFWLVRWSHLQVWEDLLQTTPLERSSGSGRPSLPTSLQRERPHGKMLSNAQPYLKLFLSHIPDWN